MRTIIVVPTFNEIENLPELIRRVEALGLDLHVLIVDDNSPDDTGRLAEVLASEREWLHVLHRPRKGGLGTAYLAGFRHALRHGYQAIGEMDADLSHDPAHLPAMLRALETADLVLGSRYTRDGGVRNWGVFRQLISRGGSLYSRLVLGVPVQDLTGGFKLFRQEVLEKLGLDRVHSNGYAFQIEMTYRAIREGFRVVEVPIIFVDRRVGCSKLSRAVVLEAMLMVPRLRLGL